MKATEIWKNLLLIVLAAFAVFDFCLIVGEDTEGTSIGYFFMIKMLAIFAAIGFYTIGKVCKEKELLPKWFIDILNKQEEQV